MEYLLSIAGYDPTGGAGVIRDILTFRKLGFYGMGVITTITYQNTKGFYGFEALDEKIVEREIEKIVEDFPIKYVKIGMVGKAADVILKFQRKYSWLTVADPLLEAKNSFPLNSLEDIEKIMERAYAITPNIPEAGKLSNVKIEKEEDILKAGKILLEKYGKYVIIKGGHGEGRDYLFGENVKFFQMPHLRKEVHGTGCAYSSALLGFLAKGYNMEEAFKEARKFVQREIERSIETGGYSLLP